MSGEQTHLQDYLWSKEISGIDNKRLLNDCLLIEEYLTNHLTPNSEWKIEYSTVTGREYKQYNTFLFPSPELNKLFHKIQQTMESFKIPGETYVMQSWINIYRENAFIDWHSHWPPECKAFHGFYCVNSEDTPSHTDYIFPPNREQIIRVNSKDGLLVYGKSEGDRHRSSGNWQSIIPRITIAFDILPTRVILENFNKIFILNHFIPI